MPPDTTAIAIVSITAGAVVALGGGYLNAQLARRQAARQFAHEREMADRADLRVYLREVLATLQDVVDLILGLETDLDGLSHVLLDGLPSASPPIASRWRRRGSDRAITLAETLSGGLSEQRRGIADEIEKLRTHLVGLSLMVGGQHPLAVTFTDVLRRACVCADAVPETFPPPDESREAFTVTWEHLADGQRDFLALASELVGVRLDGPHPRSRQSSK